MPDHGTKNAYAGGCRCESCRDAWRVYMRAWRAKRKVEGAKRRKPVRHGTVQEYGNGCRCEDCTEASRLYDEQRRRKAGVKPRAVPRCGTYGGYQAHVRQKQEPCPACLEARRVYNHELYVEQRDDRLEKMRAYYSANREYFAAKAKRRRAEHPEDPEYARTRAARYYEQRKAQEPLFYASKRARRRALTAEPVDLEAIIERDGHRCYLCDREVEPAELEFDHVVPLSRGGAHSADNLRVTHRFCNRSKGPRLLEEMAV